MKDKIVSNMDFKFNKTYINLQLSEDRNSGHEVTLNLPARIGTDISTAAEAMRLPAVADSAIRRDGFASGLGNADRDDRQNAVRADLPSASVRAPGEAGTAREDQVRTSDYHERRGPTLLFVAQMLGQDDEGALPNAADHAKATATYPSLESDLDIFLPGEDIAFAGSAPRLDIHV